MTRWEAAEKILDYVRERESFIHKIDRKFEHIVFENGPSGYVGCSNECRGAGLRRRTGHMIDTVAYLTALGQEKDRAILELNPVVCAFEKLRGTRSGHIIYYRVGKKMGVQEYADKVGISRRHCRRLYIKAMDDLAKFIAFYGGQDLLDKFL